MGGAARPRHGRSTLGRALSGGFQTWTLSCRWVLLVAGSHWVYLGCYTRVHFPQTLRTRDMLPAIWFIFSRRDCDQAAVRCAEDGIVLTSPQEQASIQEEVRGTESTRRAVVQQTCLPMYRCVCDAYCMSLHVVQVTALQASQPEAVKDTMVTALLAGLASHHAGCLPAWKTLVEGLFQRGMHCKPLSHC